MDVAGRGGFALVSVLWILAILTVMSLGFAGRAMLERRMAWYAVDREQAQHMARAAVERGLFELRNKTLLDDYNDQAGYTGLDQRWAQPINLLTEAVYFEGGREVVEGDVCEVRIEDAERRISLNYAPRAVLEGLKTVNDRAISRLLDLREPSTSDYQPALLHSIEELRGMQDFTAQQWDGVSGKPGLADLLGVWGDPAYGRLNVNTAFPGVLQCLPEMEPEVVQKIMDLRNGPDGRPYTRDDLALVSIAELFAKLDVSAEKLLGVNLFCKTDSRFFTIKAHASRRRGKINAYCTVTVEMNGTTPVILAWREGAVGASS
jgi:type II secretory pathway component PulK